MSQLIHTGLYLLLRSPQDNHNAKNFFKQSQKLFNLTSRSFQGTHSESAAGTHITDFKQVYAREREEKEKRINYNNKNANRSVY
jgi:hypothetical protein